MSLPAVVYVRISSDRTGDEAGVTRQREDCLQLAERRGLIVAEVCSDNDTSALRARKRPGYERMMSLIEEGAVSTVVAWNFERVLKTRADQLRFIEVGQDRGVLLALCRGADLDMSTPGGRLLADILSSIARNETELKSDRQKRANRQRAENGLPHVARRAFGYNPDGMTINEAEAELVREMVTKFLHGWTVRDIVRWLNGSGFTSTMGKQFTIKVVKDHLISKRNAGLRVYEGQEFEAVWQPIIDKATHQRVMAEMERRSIGVTRTPQPRRYLLTGVIQCGRCGGAMVGHAKKDPSSDVARPKYVCPEYPHGTWCGNNTRLAAPLEHLVREALIFRLDSPQLAQFVPEETPSEDLDEMLATQTALSRKLDDLVDDYADGTLSKPQFHRAKQRVEAELDGLLAVIRSIYASESASDMLAAADNVRNAWERESDGWRRKLMSHVIERVVVHPSRKRPIYMADDVRYRFDADAIEILWKA